MGMFDELKQEAAQSGAILGMVLAFVAFYFLWSIGIWAVLIVVAIGGGAFFWFTRKRPSS